MFKIIAKGNDVVYVWHRRKRVKEIVKGDDGNDVINSTSIPKKEKDLPCFSSEKKVEHFC